MPLVFIRRQSPFHLPLLLVYTFAINFSIFIGDFSYPVWEYSFLFNILEIEKISLSNNLVALISLLLTFIQAVLINSIIVKYQLIEQRNLLGAYIYVTITALFPYIILPSPAFFSLFFVLAVVHNMLGLFDVKNAAQKLFFSAFFLTLGGLLYSPVFLFFILLLLSSFLLKSPKLEEIIIIPMGFFTPVFLLFFCFYFFDNLDVLIYCTNLIPQLEFLFNLNNVLHIISMSYLLVILIIGYFNYHFVFSNKTVKLARYHQMFFVYFMLMIAALIFTSLDKFSFISFFLIPLTLFLTTTFNFQSKKYPSFLFTGLFLLALIAQFEKAFF